MTMGDSSLDPNIIIRAHQIVKDSTPELQVIDEESASKQILMESSSPSYASLSLGNSIRERQLKRKLEGMKPEKRIHEFQDRVEQSTNGLMSTIQPQ